MEPVTNEELLRDLGQALDLLDEAAEDPPAVRPIKEQHWQNRYENLKARESMAVLRDRLTRTEAHCSVCHAAAVDEGKRAASFQAADKVEFVSDEGGWEMHVTSAYGRTVYNIHGLAWDLVPHMKETLGGWRLEGESVRTEVREHPIEHDGYYECANCGQMIGLRQVMGQGCVMCAPDPDLSRDRQRGK